jgi:hypothetical protein
MRTACTRRIGGGRSVSAPFKLHPPRAYPQGIRVYGAGRSRRRARDLRSPPHLVPAEEMAFDEIHHVVRTGGFPARECDQGRQQLSSRLSSRVPKEVARCLIQIAPARGRRTARVCAMSPVRSGRATASAGIVPRSAATTAVRARRARPRGRSSRGIARRQSTPPGQRLPRQAGTDATSSHGKWTGSAGE